MTGDHHRMTEENRRMTRRLLLVYRVVYGVLAVISAFQLADRDAPLWTYAVLAVLPASFLLLVKVTYEEGAWDLPGQVHIGIAFLGIAALSVAEHGTVLVAYMLLPLVFTFIDTFVISALLAMAVYAVLAFDPFDPASNRDGLGAAVVEFTATTAITLFAVGLIQWSLRQTRLRGELVEQLESTRTELAEAEHEAGVRAERERMAREIHDTLAQGFTSILMLLQAADAVLDTDPAATRHRLDLAQRAARDNLAEARALVAAQDPEHLAAESLHEALGRTVAGLGEELDIAAEFSVVGDSRDLPATVQVILIRAVQESTANIRKHAQASSVTAELTYRVSQIRLTVTDDGRGFDPALDAGGYGLPGMRARLARVDGTVEVDAAPGAGTTVRVEVPL